MPPKKAGVKKTRSSRYNTFIKQQLAKLKAEKPEMEHRERFKLAAQSWARSDEDPRKKAA